MSSTNTEPLFIFIDGSYFIYNCYFTIINIYKNKLEDGQILEDIVMTDKFLRHYTTIFNNKLTSVKNNFDKQNRAIIIVGKDCSRNEIWRTSLYSKYKGNRPKNNCIKYIFNYTYNHNLFINNNARTILYHPKLEADDCIALTVKFIKSNLSKYIINIITSDADYLQLVSSNINIYDLNFKNISEKSLGDSECNLFCKIVAGDSSDNIKSIFPKCGPKTALKYYNDKEKFNNILNISFEYVNNYELNKQLIDFKNIPKNLEYEFLSTPLKIY